MQVPPTPLKRRTALSILWSAVENVGYHLINITAFFFFIRILSPEDFGRWALFILFTEICGPLINPGLTAVLLSRNQVGDTELSSVFWHHTMGAVICICFALAGAPLWESLFSAPGLSEIVRFACPLILLDSLALIPDLIFRRKMDFKTIAYRRLTGIIAGFLIGIPLLLFTHSIWSLVCFHLLSSLGRLVVLWARCPWRPRLRFQFSSIRNIAGDGALFTSSTILRTLASRTPVFFIGLFYSTATLGFFSVAYRIISIMIDMLSPVVAQVCTPLFSIFKSDLSPASRYYLKLFHFSACMTIPTFSGMSLTASWSIPLICGPQWQASVLPLQWLALGALFKALSYKSTSILLGLGKFQTILIFSAIELLVYLTLIGTSSLISMVAVSIALCFCYFLIWPLSESLIWRELQISFSSFIAHLIGPTLATAIMLLACAMVMRLISPSLLHFSLLAIGSAVLYGLFLLLIDYPKILHWASAFHYQSPRS